MRTAREYYDNAYYGTHNPDDLVALIGHFATEDPPLYLREDAAGRLLIGDNGGTEEPIDEEADIDAEIAEWRAAAGDTEEETR